MESITEAVLKYQETGEGYRSIVERVSIIIYNYPDRVNSLTEEDKCDFFLSFYSRIKGLISNFSYRGSAFEALLIQTLKWHSLSYISKLKKEKQLMAFEIREGELLIRDSLDESRSDEEIHSLEIDLKSQASKKRLLYLVLMDTPNLSDRELEKFSQMSGYDCDWLLDLKDRINGFLHGKSGRLTDLREKRNNYFSRIQYYQTLLYDELIPHKRSLLEEKISRLQKRLEDTRREISRVPARPTHGEIAQLLGVPKGTVDSGLHYFRKMVREIAAENRL